MVYQYLNFVSKISTFRIENRLQIRLLMISFLLLEKDFLVIPFTTTQYAPDR